MTFRKDVSVPPVYAVHSLIEGNRVVQLSRDVTRQELTVTPAQGRGRNYAILDNVGGEVIAISTKTITKPEGVDRLLVLTNTVDVPAEQSDWNLAGQPARWADPKPLNIKDERLDDSLGRVQRVIDSWDDAFHYKEERIVEDGWVLPGLRGPQLGALHAALGHWKASVKPATVVMPTGTGKTETMLSLLVAQRIPRLLVLVPSDALRDQIGSKFVNLGWLKRFGIVSSQAELPVVCFLKKMPREAAALQQLLQRCNVIVATMRIAAGSRVRHRDTLVAWASHLFIDEAHHVSATTWTSFRDHFGDKPVLQFTATPFRTDGKLVDGKVIFNYPLRRAQAEGYFKPIRFRPLVEYNNDRADHRIMNEAVSALREDLAAGLDHVLMARVQSISRAEAIHRIYSEQARDLQPLIVHSEQTQNERKFSLEALRSREVAAEIRTAR